MGKGNEFGTGGRLTEWGGKGADDGREEGQALDFTSVGVGGSEDRVETVVA